MIEINSKDFEVKVLMNTKGDKAHTDVTQPQVSKKPGANGKPGKFFQVSLLAKRTGPAPVQGKRILFSVWDSGQRALIFDEIARTLADAAKFIVDPIDKGARLNDNVLIFKGELWSEPAISPEGVPFKYYRVDANGKPLINTRTKQPNITDVIQMFVFDFEALNGTKELLFATENARAYEHRVKVTAPAESGTTVLDEDEPTTAEETTATKK